MNRNYAKILVLVITSIQFVTSLCYLAQKDWRHAAYWFLIVLINLVVTL